MNESFSKAERLCSKILIQKLFSEGETKRFGSFTLKILYKTDDKDSKLPQIIISIPKKYQKLSVSRNKTKRLIREAYRKQKIAFLEKSGIELLGIVYSNSKVPSLLFVEEQMKKFMETLLCEKRS